MNTENAQKLVAALRSGQYPQAKGALRKAEGYCCLGVACDISGLGKWEVDPRSAPDPVDGSYIADRYVVRDETGKTICSDTSVLPYAVARWLDMEVGGAFEIPVSTMELRPEDEDRETGNYFALTELNDGGLTFNQIADVLENVDMFGSEAGPNVK